MQTSAAGEKRAALAAGIGSNLIWGFLPLAMQAIARTGPGPWEILAQRVVWGAVAAGVFVLLARQGGQVLRIVREPKTLALLALSSALIAVNWVVFIWAVTTGRVLESSLGYYIIPLLNMAVGALVFREKLSRIAIAAIALAALGVAVQTLAVGRLPWVSLALAVSFGGYGIVRKQVKADAQSGLFIECLTLMAPCLIYIGWLQHAGLGHFTAGPMPASALIAAGVLTATPLAMFSWAARRLPLSVIGFLQFFSPTVSFFIGVAQGEPFRALNGVAFVLIWIGAALFVLSAVRSARDLRRGELAPQP